MGSLNRVQLLGNMGAEPKVQTLQSGNRVATFSMATSDPAYTLPNGTQVPERTEWHNVVTWGKLADIVAQYVPKGAQLYIEGKLRTRKYTNKDGAEKYITEVVADNVILLRGNGYKPQNAENGPYSPQNLQGGTTYQPRGENAAQRTAEGKKEDDLPF